MKSTDMADVLATLADKLRDEWESGERSAHVDIHGLIELLTIISVEIGAK